MTDTSIDSQTTSLIDTHRHLDAYPDAGRVLSGATRAGIRMIAVTNTPDAYRRLATVLPRSGPAIAALGLHPLHVHHLGLRAVLRFSRHAGQAASIGEVGLDFSATGRATRDTQLAVFDALLALPQLRDRPVTVHSRGAEKSTVQRLADAGVRAVLHWYTGPLGVADDALAAGMYFSINPAMVASQKGRTLLARLPHDRVLRETDGPHTRSSGRPSEPADITALADGVARLWQVHPDQARASIAGNQQRFCRPGPD